MKKNRIPRPAVALLVAGLMLATIAPLICRHFELPDYAAGFVMGTGIGLEILAILFIRHRKPSVS